MKKLIKRILSLLGCVTREEHDDLFKAYGKTYHAYDKLGEQYKELSEGYINYLKMQDSIKINSLMKFGEDYYFVTDIESRQSINPFFEDGVEKILNIELKSIDNLVNKQIKKEEAINNNTIK